MDKEKEDRGEGEWKEDNTTMIDDDNIVNRQRLHCSFGLFPLLQIKKPSPSLPSSLPFSLPGLNLPLFASLNNNNNHNHNNHNQLTCVGIPVGVVGRTVGHRVGRTLGERDGHTLGVSVG